VAFASLPARAITALAAIERLSFGDLSAQQMIAEIVDQAVGVLHSDMFFAATVDPYTGLCLGTAFHNLDPDACAPAWEHEFLVPDYNKFADLTPDRPVGDLRLATGGQLSRSPRYRTLNEIADLEDELRATLPAGGRSWGNLIFSRHTGDGPFTDQDRAFLAAAAPLAGAALRRAMLDEPHRALPTRGPGIIVINEVGETVSATAEAEAWLEELAPGHTDTASTGIRPELLLMPLIAASTRGAFPRGARLRTPRGTWLVAHASPLGDTGQIGIVIEPAKASEITPITVEAFGLTSRETQVATLVAQGQATAEIAAALFLSQHTVRGHLKAIFDKTRVSTRGELTSKLFTEAYRGPLTQAVRTPIDHLTDRAERDAESS
jgi:DNA-binding CsgD family transcriptional regulator